VSGDGGGGHHHGHGQGRHGGAGRLAATLALAGGYMLVEIAGGVLSGSLALLADAGHMLSDVAALALSLVAMRLATRPPTAREVCSHKGESRLEGGRVNYCRAPRPLPRGYCCGRWDEAHDLYGIRHLPLISVVHPEARVRRG